MTYFRLTLATLNQLHFWTNQSLTSFLQAFVLTFIFNLQVPLFVYFSSHLIVFITQAQILTNLSVIESQINFLQFTTSEQDFFLFQRSTHFINGIFPEILFLLLFTSNLNLEKFLKAEAPAFKYTEQDLQWRQEWILQKYGLIHSHHLYKAI